MMTKEQLETENQRLLIQLGETVLERDNLESRVQELEKVLGEVEKFILQKGCLTRCTRGGGCCCGKWRTITAIRQAKGQA